MRQRAPRHGARASTAMNTLRALLLMGLVLAPTCAPHLARAQEPPRARTALPIDRPDATGTMRVEVELEIVVGADGALRDATPVEIRPEPVETSVHDALAARALEHVRALSFDPATDDAGRPIPARVRYVVVFPERAVVREIALPHTTFDTEDDRAPASATSAETHESERVGEDAGTSEDAHAPTFGARAEVVAPARERPPSAVSDHDIDVGALGRVPRDDAQSMLTLAPGVLLSNHGGEGHAASMFLRGFDAEEGEDLEVLVDGIPLNDVSNAHGHGYVDSTFIVPELVESIRVVQGPFDPAQGDFAIAGTAEYRLGLRERGIHVGAAYGTYEERRVHALWGPEGEPSATFAGASFRDGAGWGANRAFAQGAAIAQVEVPIASRFRLRLLGLGSAATWRQAGPLRDDDWRAGRLPCAGDDFAQFFCTYDPSQGGSSYRGGGAATLEWSEGPTWARAMLQANAHGVRVRESFTGFLLDPRTDGGPQRGDAVDQRYDAVTVSARATMRHRFVVLERAQTIELGLAVRHDDGASVQDRVRRELGVPYLADFDREMRVTSLALHARADASVLEWLALSGGARIDGFGFGVVDRNRPDVDRIGERLPRETTSAFGWLLQPRGSLHVVFAPELRWVTSAGLGARSSDAAALSEGELAPFAEVLALESGLAWNVGEETAPLRVEGGASAFFTRVSRDLVFDAERGRNTVTGASHRSGATVFSRLRIDSWLDVDASLTYTRGHLPPPGAGAFELFAGPRLPFIPEWLFRIDAAAQHAVVIAGERVAGSVAVGFLALGQRPLPLERVSEPWWVLDAAVAVRWRFVELGVRAQNLLDQRYRQAELNYVSSFAPDRAPSRMAERHFVAAPPLRVLVQLSVHVELFRGEEEP
ncbi:TonB-dependent receptor [Sandaracinus amylolyticus]|uniref:Nicel/Cobalt-specific TonB-dependent outer membrane receptor n=1 Tax=Sandaracinus amylolyticus TaxID=927083 RepID=A0A0F6W0N2_9BACT|nr:TonB-dependent receptor [Sandaracinus amylolyticus]AKF04430.1 Nicel/Cobalt-specific TonB-dependent outer membrane receptor [Sandaracinus amylolyticus]